MTDWADDKKGRGINFNEIIYSSNNKIGQMTDYTYDNEDFTAMRVATADLKAASCNATWTGLATGATWLGFDYWTSTIKKKSVWGMGPRYAIGFSILAGSLSYCILTWGSRQRLDIAAEHINTKYSSIISRTLNYEK